MVLVLWLMVATVSTHSRLKAAGSCYCRIYDKAKVSTHSRLKAAGSGLGSSEKSDSVSTHSRLKAAGEVAHIASGGIISFNTQPPEGGWTTLISPPHTHKWFQHTAA